MEKGTDKMLSRGKPGVDAGKVQTWSRQIDSRILNTGMDNKYTGNVIDHTPMIQSMSAV